MSKTQSAGPRAQGTPVAYFLIVALVIIALGAMVYAFVRLTAQARSTEAHLALAGEQQLLSLTLSHSASAALEKAHRHGIGGKPDAGHAEAKDDHGSAEGAHGSGEAHAHAEDGHADEHLASLDTLRAGRDRMDAILKTLREGSAGGADGHGHDGVPPAPESAQSALNAVTEAWLKVRADVETILNARAAISAIRQFEPLLEQRLPQMITAVDELSRSQLAAGASASQTYQSTRMLLALQRIEANITRMLSGGAGFAIAADQLGRDLADIRRTVNALQRGDVSAGILPVSGADARQLLATLVELVEVLDADAGRVFDTAPELFEAQAAIRSVGANAPQLQAAAAQMLNHFRGSSGQAELLPGVWMGVEAAYAMGAVAAFLLLLLWSMQGRDAKLRNAESERLKQEAEERNRRNQDAILRLLDEMGELADGDLTVHVSVTEDITGAIADSMNYAIEALRDLVTTIKDTSRRLAASSQDTGAIAERLATASEAQATQIESATGLVRQMASAMDQSSTDAQASTEVATRSVSTAHEGGERVRRTIQGMDVIREHIQETSKRIKRLGESSQEIGAIVELINDIADQTNILALNAAIQASAAGEAGRGFAVVADEVQRLAERSGNATKRIETLVKAIQADTNEAIASMEKSTSEVVNGADLAVKAGESLNEIETVSGRLAGLIESISRATTETSEIAGQVAATMGSISEITEQTAEGSASTATSLNKLQQLAQELQQSVAGFRLPSGNA